MPCLCMTVRDDDRACAVSRDREWSLCPLRRVGVPDWDLGAGKEVRLREVELRVGCGVCVAVAVWETESGVGGR